MNSILRVHVIYFFLSFILLGMARPNAGGLPYSFDDHGRLIFLLGKEPSGQWSDIQKINQELGTSIC